jgi:hypothetical protein
MRAWTEEDTRKTRTSAQTRDDGEMQADIQPSGSEARELA